MNIREDAAKYYDLQDNPTADIPFYRTRIPSVGARVLELGCGTGRVMVPLARECGFIHGIDASPAMLSQCQEKLNREGLPPDRAQISRGDISDFDLGTTFDLIIAPYRVMQNLETDAEVSGLMRGIRRHLAPGGRAILNMFSPYRSAEEIERDWCSSDELFEGEMPLPDGGRLVRTDRRPRLRVDPLVLYPELIYRRYSAAGTLEDEAVLKIAMRCWYPDQLEALIQNSGFRTTNRWGGYLGERWAEGTELVIEFTAEM